MRVSTRENIPLNNLQRANASLNANIWDESHDEYESRKTQEFASWLQWLKSKTIVQEFV